MHTLVTDRLRLEPLVIAHADALFPLLADTRQLAFLDRKAPGSLQALRERHRRLESRCSADGSELWLNWALCPRSGAADAIGYVQATLQADRVACVAYEVGHAWWGQGYGSEATRAMVEHLVARYGITQCRATVDTRNLRSRRLLERLGFRQAEGEVQAGDVLYLGP